MKVLREAGWGNTSGDANVCLGYQAGKNYTTESNQLVIGNSATSELTYGEFDNEIVKLNAAVTTTKAIYTSAVETITAALDVLDNTNHIILADASSNNIQLILPAASGNTGLTYIIKRIEELKVIKQ